MEDDGRTREEGLMARMPRCWSDTHPLEDGGCPKLAWMPDEYGGCTCDCHHQEKEQEEEEEDQ